MKKYLLLIFLLLTVSCTTNNYHNYYYQSEPTENIKAEPKTNKEVVILGRTSISINKEQGIISQSINSTNNIEVVVPEFTRISVDGDVTFNVTDLTEIESSSNLLVNVKYNKIKGFEYIVLRMYTINLDNKNGLVGNWDGETIPINAKNDDLISEFELIPNEMINAGLFDYMELDSWGSGCNNNLKKAIKIKNMPVYFMADFSTAIDQTYSTILIIELAGVLL